MDQLDKLGKDVQFLVGALAVVLGIASSIVFLSFHDGWWLLGSLVVTVFGVITCKDVR